MRLRRTALGFLLLLGGAGLIWTSGLLIHGGFDVFPFGIKITSNDPVRPAILTVVAIGAFVWLGGVGMAARWLREAPGAIGRAPASISAALIKLPHSTSALWRRIELRQLDRVMVAALAIATLGTGLRYGARSVGGSDSYGYVSQADLWLRGQLSQPQHWAEAVPLPRVTWAFTPLGYRPGPARWIETPPIRHAPRDPWTIVPTYAAGYPMIMAAAKAIAGHAAMFWVVPIAGALLVLLTYGLGTQLSSRATGLVAAWFVATSPVFLMLLVAPMSDIPSATAWAAAFWFAIRGRTSSSAAAGLSAGIAVLIRPNLVPLAVTLWLIPAVRLWRTASGTRRIQVVQFALVLAGTAAGAAAAASVQWALYGSPFRSGYAPLEQMFAWSNVAPNVRVYSTWFAALQTPLAFLGMVALAWRPRWLWPADRHRFVIPIAAAFVGVLWLMYFWYDVFETPYYLRFVLSSWPFIMIGFATFVLAPWRLGLGPFLGAVTALALVGIALLGIRGVLVAHADHAFEFRELESRYSRAALEVRRRTGERSVVIAMQHTGSLRYYGGRITLQHDAVPGDELDRIVQWFGEHDIHTYALLEDWEILRARDRFKTQRAAANLETPIFNYGHSYFFDLQPDPGPRPALEILQPTPADLGAVRPVPPPTMRLAVSRAPGAGK